jgi:UDP-N-acetyl-D-mannosaminuronic acid dehydrogenase
MSDNPPETSPESSLPSLHERIAFTTDVVVVGGCGHVGLPLAIAFADRGLKTVSYDINPDTVALVNRGVLPFDEPDAGPVIERVVASGMFRASIDPTVISSAEHVVVVIGTPVDEHLNPDARAVPDAVAAVHGHLRPGQLLVLRSTVYPGVTALVEKGLVQGGLHGVEVAFCPERIAEGKAMTELFELPQIVSARTDDAVARADRLFRHLTISTVQVTPEEAELAKLFTNTWRYIKFAASNQLFMMANDFGLDFERIRHAITFDYPRAQDMPGPGFAAGPCLFKDTMQLAAFNDNKFVLGHSAMLVNEGLPLYVVSRVAARFDLENMTVGILGMAFKGESDDTRSSLSYKLRRILRFRAANVLCADPYVRTDEKLASEEELLERSDVVIIGAPHRRYRTLQTDVPVIDIWNITGNGVRI